jgi:hypothetical protein
MALLAVETVTTKGKRFLSKQAWRSGKSLEFDAVLKKNDLAILSFNTVSWALSHETLL